MSFGLHNKDRVIIRKALSEDIEKIHRLLLESFQPYRGEYAKQAYEATVVSPKEIEIRISDPEIEVLVAEYNDQIVGTATINLQREDDLYVQTMAVKPSTQGKGIGRTILKQIQSRAQVKGCKTISLECYEPLKSAIKLYKRFGFRRTGRKRIYKGITIFEMKKETNQGQIE